MAAVVEVSRFYRSTDQSFGTHLALRWKGRVRYTVPREAASQRACWKFFQPGRLDVPLRAMAHLPRLLGAVSCVEAENLASIRGAIGTAPGLSCCRAGAPGPWSKDTILFLDKRLSAPLYVVKAGTGEEVCNFLRNEADWLRALRDSPFLHNNVPELVVHRSGPDLCFLAQNTLSGSVDFELGELQLGFLQKLQESSVQSMRYQDSRLYRTLSSRIGELSGLLTQSWSNRLDSAMRKIEHSLSGSPTPFVASHNDFTPWNIRIEQGIVKVFDWEYADHEQFPLFDPLQFILMPRALNGQSVARMVQSMYETFQLCEKWLGIERCYKPQTQVLGYLLSICTLYLRSVRGNYRSHTVLDLYALLIDELCPN